MNTTGPKLPRPRKQRIYPTPARQHQPRQQQHRQRPVGRVGQLERRLAVAEKHAARGNALWRIVIIVGLLLGGIWLLAILLGAFNDNTSRKPKPERIQVIPGDRP